MNGHFPIAFIIGATVLLSVLLKKLTAPAALCGGLLAACIYAGAGAIGLALLGAFFVGGTAASAYKRRWKEAAGLATKEDRSRTTGQVLANGGVAALCGLAALLLPHQKNICTVMLAASFASALGDTLSSELGMVWGRRFYNIRTFRKDERGRDGVVSWEGSLIGAMGSLLIALIYMIGFSTSISVVWIAVAGIAGNGFDSLLGATLERRQVLNNNAVNFLNTFFAALLAGAMASFF